MWYKEEAIRYISEMNDVDKLRSVYTAAKYLNQADATKSKPKIKTDVDKLTLDQISHTLFDVDDSFLDISVSLSKMLASYETMADESGLWERELTDEKALMLKENHERLSALHIITHDELIFLQDSVASVRKTLDDLYENIKQAHPSTEKSDSHCQTPDKEKSERNVSKPKKNRRKSYPALIPKRDENGKIIRDENGEPAEYVLNTEMKTEKEAYKD